MEAPPVGSLVVPSPDFRSAMRTGEGAAILLALKRGSGNLYYPGTDRRYWVPMRDVRPIPPEAVSEASLERLLSDLLLSLEAEECVIHAKGPASLDVAVDHPGLSRDALHALEQRLGARLADYAYEPGSMRVATLRLSLVSLPAAADTGT